MLKQYKLKDYRFRLVAYVLILSVIGILVIGSARSYLQTKQMVGVAGGTIIMIIVSCIDYNFIVKFYRLAYALAVLLLGLVLVLGANHKGATRWIEIGGFQFQPSELCKVLLIVFFAGFFMKYQEQLNTWRILGLSIVLIGIPLLLIYKEPNLSTTIFTTLLFLALLFVAGLSYKIVAVALGISIPVGVVGVILVMKRALPLQPYQYNRIMSWLDPAEYGDTSTQQLNSIMAIGSGQLFGKGLNNSSVMSMKNGNFIAEPQTDFIFTIIGEEMGFVGCAIVIMLLLFTVFECILIAKNARNLSGRLICCGMAAWIGFQGFINISVTTGIMPNTGVPLPFVSYGLTSLVSLFIGLGLVLNVGLQARKYGTGDIDL